MSGNGNPMNGWLQSQAALIDEAADNLRRFAKLPFLWRQAERVKKGATPSEVVYDEDRLQLLHYLRDKPSEHDTPLLVVFALVNRPYILDILPKKSVVANFVEAGFDTYMIDWGVPTHADRHLTLETYINGYMANVVDFIQERTGSPKVNVLGYCMGGTMSAMFTALHPEDVKNLMLLASGIDFSTREGLINLWTDAETFDVDAFIDAFGNCPAEFLQASFLLRNPIGNFIRKPLSLLEGAADDKFVTEYFTMETWVNDNIAVPGEVFREFVKYLYQQNLLVKNQMPIGRHLVNLERVTCPVLNIMATGDDLVPPAQSEPFNDLIGSNDHKILKMKAGHVGLVMGSRAQRELWPEAVAWLSERS